MNDLFERAKAIGLSCVKTWLPGGRQNGDEWIVKNPTRADQHEGSFSVNTRTGAWSDFAESGASGRDAVSLYAYLNRSRMESLASGKQYKNREGGIQAEAAREIITTYDPDYFPGSDDDFTPPTRQKSSDPWDGFTWLSRGVEKAPELSTSWFEDKWGRAEKTWDFLQDGRVTMKVVRFRDEHGKKNDRPFTIWQNGGEPKWRAKAPDGLYPIWGAHKLENRPNDRVILTEGQKAAAALEPVLTGWLCIGWYGGTNAVKKQNWEPTRGREVWFPFDGDHPGRKALADITEIAREYQWKLHIVYPPLSVPKGWDLADAVEEGWTREKIEAHILEEKPALDTAKDPFIDDPDAYHLRVLGFSADHIVIYPFGQCRIVKLKPASITKASMIGLQDKARWKALFGSETGIRWDDAQNQLIRMAEELPMFDPNRVRGAGAWLERGELVLNDGAHIIKSGKTIPLYEATEYVYERSKSIPYTEEFPLSTEQTVRLLEMLYLISWKRKRLDPILISGWLLLAPLCGALKWKPHVWITGSAGSGKSWVMENIFIPMVAQEFGVHGKGTSTAAGVRNELGGSALPFVMDEMESDNQRQHETIEQILRLFREGSGKSDSSTLQASEGTGTNRWNFQSMGAFASIGASMRSGADRSRFVIVDMTTDKTVTQDVRAQRFQELEALRHDVITQSWSRGFVSRTIRIWDEVQRSIDICIRAVANILKSQRDGDRIGTLFGGAWMVSHDTAPSAGEARQWIEGMDIDELSTESSVSPDEQLCFEEIMAAKIELDSTSNRRTIGALIDHWYRSEVAFFSDGREVTDKLDLQEIKRAVEQYGIKLMGDTGKIYVARNHPAIKRILRDTAWAYNYEDVLKRLPACAEMSRSPSRFSGVQFRYLNLDSKMLFGNEYESE